MKNSLLFSLLGLMIIATMFSCGKSESLTPTNLIIGTWELTDRTISPELPTTGNDAYSDMHECEKDDLLIFEDANVLRLDNGNIKCDVRLDQILDGTYSLNAETNSISTSINGESLEWTYTNIDDGEMEIKRTIDLSGREYEYTYFYSKLR